ncbi:hypothetical protein H0E87_028279 [Populus deltoides]|uniref:Uncharacterized protein n=1 Tax=Populus deltoides TaxID=3696 RepID=A0A8T2WUY6_POPDE|nr:hypothetical protein H0E87_028279 [Populus deltoides]
MRKRKVTYVEDVTIEFVGSGKSLLMVVVQLRKVVASSGSRLKLLEMKNVALERLKKSMTMRKNASGATVMEEDPLLLLLKMMLIERETLTELLVGLIGRYVDADIARVHVV